MTVGLFFQAMVKFACGVVLVGALLFGCAGTWGYINGWLFMAILFVPMFAAGVVMMMKNPALLQKRLQAREKEHAQKTVIALDGLMFLAGFMLAGLDHRFGWTHVPRGVVAVAAVLFLAAYGMYAEVLRENTYLSRTVEVQENQKIIDTGLYGVVRHPMYSATLLLFLMMPLVLGSWVSFAVFCVYPVLTAARIQNEEKVLEEGLSGYRAYKTRVRFRLVPWIW